MKIKAFFASHIGKKRRQNQDAGVASVEQGIFLVADGMGGHLGGQVASNLAVESVLNVALATSQESVKPAAFVAKQAILQANFDIYQKSARNEDLRGMGTTMTLVVHREGKLAIGHVGDSRCYLYWQNQLWQLTEDHSLVEEKFRARIITRERRSTDTMKNILTRSVGFEPHLQPDIFHLDLGLDAFVLLICSDGLTGHLPDEQILACLANGLPEVSITQGDLEKTCWALVEAANGKGGEDNISCLLLHCDKEVSAQQTLV
jgi:protein phosphatase